MDSIPYCLVYHRHEYLENSHALTFVICSPVGEPIQNLAVLSSAQNDTLEI
jgi:hypothetical protein